MGGRQGGERRIPARALGCGAPHCAPARLPPAQVRSPLASTAPLLERALRAQLNEHHARDLRLMGLRWLAVASVPVWLQTLWGFLPDLLAYWALLGQGACIVIAGALAVLERRWRRRAAQLEGTSSVPVVHSRWTSWDELRLALWQALAVISLVPWGYVVIGRPLPGPLLAAVLAAAVAVFLLAVVAETLPRLGRRETTP